MKRRGNRKEKAEILQLIMLERKFAILDETYSELDADAMKTVSKGIQEFQRRKQGALFIITHNIKFLDNIQGDKVHILGSDPLVKTGGTSY